MATQTSPVTRSVSVLAAAALVAAGLLAGCTPRPDGPTPVAEQFFAALATGNTSAAATLSDRPDDTRAALNAAWAGLQADHLDAQILSSTFARGHGQRRLPLHLASAKEPHLDLRRPAVHDPRRGSLGGQVDPRGAAPQARRAPDVRVAGRPAAARIGQRGWRNRRAQARIPLPLRARRDKGRRTTDVDSARRRGHVAAVRQHARPATARRAGQLDKQAGGPHHAATRRQQPGVAGDQPAARRCWSHRRPICFPPTTGSRRPWSIRSRRR